MGKFGIKSGSHYRFNSKSHPEESIVLKCKAKRNALFPLSLLDFFLVLFAVPPETPVIVMNDANGNFASNQVGPYNEGSALHLTCEVSGGKEAKAKPFS